MGLGVFLAQPPLAVADLALLSLFAGLASHVCLDQLRSQPTAPASSPPTIY
jgi:hypothetical protein